MAPLIYPATQLDSDQVIQYVYDEATQTLRTTATAVIVGQPIEVEIDMATDSIKLGDGTTLFTSTTVGPKTGLDVSIINTIPISGSITVTNFPTTVDTNYGVVGASTLRTASQIGNATGVADFGSGTTSAQTLRVVLPTDQSAISVTQGTSPWVISGTVAATQSGTWNINNISGTISLPTGAATSALQTTGNTSLSSIDSKLNSLGQKVSAASVPVVIASDQSPIAVTGTITTSPDVNIHDGAGNSLTSQVNGAQRALDVGIDVAGVQIDPRQIRALTAADVVTANAGTGNFTVVQPTGTNLHAVIDSGTIVVTQGTSPWVTSGTYTSSDDKNYGVVGANTLRTAAQIGNATGAALFGAGTTTAQVLRVVLPTDQSSIPVTQSGTWNIGTLTSITNPVTVTQGTSPWVISGTVDQGGAALPGNAWYMRITDGSTTAGITAFSLNVNVTNTVPISGTVSVSNLPTTVDTNYGTVGASTIRTAAQIGNATGAAAFNTGTTTAQTLRVVLPTDQTAIPVTQSTSPWVVSGTVAATQSGTWNINNISGTISLPTGASTSALQTTGNTSLASIVTNTNSLILAQGSTTSGQTGNLIMGAVTTAAPTYTTAQTSPLSLTTSGALRTDSSATTQPISGTVSVSGTVAITQSTSPWVISGTVTAAEDKNYGTVGATTLRTAAQIGNATGAALFGAGTTTAQVLRVVLPTDQTAIPVTQSTSPWVISGTVTANNASVSTTGTTPPASATYIGGSVTTAAPTYTTGQMNALSLNTSGGLRVDGSGVTQPVSGTVTVSQATASSLNAQVQGAAASGAAKAGNPVQTGAVFNTTQPTVTTGQVVENQATARGALIVATGVDNFNINNISGTISLPTGAATEASLAKLTQTQGSTTSGQSGPLILGAVTTASPTYTTAQSSPLSLDTSGSLRVTGGQVADKTTFTYGTTNFANIGGVFQDTSPSLTAGQSGVVRLTANRAEHVNLRDASGNELLGQKTMANSLPVVLASDQTSLPVTVGPIIRASYSGSSTTGFSADPLGGTDIFTLGGSATKTVRVVRLIITATRTTSSNIDIALVRRSTVNSGGVGFPLTSVTHDTTNAAATTQPIEYTTNPTLGTLVGYIRAQKMFINAPATGASDVIRWDFSDLPEQAIVLRGTSQVLAVNLSGVVITGSAFCISIDWTEE